MKKIKLYLYRLLSFIPYFKRKMALLYKEVLVNRIDNVVNQNIRSFSDFNLFTFNGKGICIHSTFNNHKIEYIFSINDIQFSFILTYLNGVITKQQKFNFSTENDIANDMNHISSLFEKFKNILDTQIIDYFVSLNDNL